MLGIFAHWQPAYAEAGVSTFPVHGEAKRPAVGNYLRGGRQASAEWARKFPDADALGFACGKRNRLTVLDIDAPDERLFADAMNKLGPSPVVIRTASGKFHAWYRHNGEGRSVRRAAQHLGLTGPVDILGNGFALAPPSRGAQGAYEWIQGSLADLENLPAMRLSNPGQSMEAIQPAGQNNPDRIQQGGRNAGLFRLCLAEAGTCLSRDNLVAVASALNSSKINPPLPDDEVRAIASRAWGYEERGENWAGVGRRVAMHHDELDPILELGADPFMLAMYLRRHHWGRDFVIANAMAEHMPGGAWTTKRLAAARRVLVQASVVVEIRAASMKNGPALYRFGKKSPA